MSFYEKKAEFHHKEWELAHNLGKDKAAEFHMQEYLNYQKLIEQVKE